MTKTATAPTVRRDGLLYRFGLWLGRHAKAVLILGGIALVVFGVIGVGAFGKLKAGGFEDLGSDSSRAAAITNAHFAADPNLLLVVTPDDGRLDSAPSKAAGSALTTAIASKPDVTVTGSYWTTPAAGLAATDRSSGLITVVISGDHSVSRAADLSAEFSGERGGVTVKVGGQAAVLGDINRHVSSSLVLAEAIALPLTLILLLVVFGSVVAALLPLLIGAFAIAGTFFELSVLGSITDVSVFAINLTTALGLGLGIDYGLLLVARFREQLAAGEVVDVAVARTVATAGRTILFSAAAVVAALATLILFPLYFLSSFGYAGIGVVLIAALGALVLIPAALALLGRRVDAGRLPFTGTARNAESRFWLRFATAVFRHPVRTGGPVLVVLLLAAVPLMGIKFALPDASVLPTDAASRQVATILAQQYPSQSTAVITLVSATPTDSATATAAGAIVSKVPGVTGVEFGTATPDTLSYRQLKVSTDAPKASEAAKSLVKAIRAAAPGTAAAVFLVGGSDASLTDTLSGIGHQLPWVLLIIVVTTFILLFLFTGSVLQPLRALVVNGLSLSASIGVVTWIFQDGHLIGLLGATARPMDASMTVLLLSITFGLSMDYEVFLASRITELHFAGSGLQDAVTHGLARTGRLVSSAALLLAVSFFAFTTSSVSMLQLFGFGAGLAVLIDATLIRGVLVPAVMRLLGPANFWSPGPLRKLHAKVGLSEE
ncbi:putative drug exporter of the RND superfamily [Nakamurella panacisegetis]|uniref:Putative drug exporter of the RND superfamily n=1 Tax=Nakamurella panacisegetis TaxID=1090615 RepID=A0A1H0M927_9ACTN|nr:MMPL family transporter [Nakamurella panacisegetis]SDO77008.1 putative drug exporter of the RND superfamily [Nakamurella panacisegetis]